MAPRLDTPLSKALIESGSLDPSALEEAVQEQMIHGGALDTILLEKGAVEERALAALLAQAWQTDPVPLDDIERPAAAAVKALPERMALAMRLCPFAVEGTAVHVMCTSPLDRGLIEEVSALLKKPLVPHVVPEVRLWQGLQQAYGTAPDERFAALLTDLRSPAKPGDGSEEGAPFDDMRDASDPGAAKWDLVEALAHLASQDSRDGIARVATSYARKFMPFAAMIGVRTVDGSAQCVGWLRSGPAEGVQFSNRPYVITADSVLDGALKSPSPSLGKPAITSGNAALFGWLGRRRPRTFLVVPIVVAAKPVGALVADGGIRSRDIGSLSDLVSFAARLGPAFETLLRKRHAQSLPPAPAGAQMSDALTVQNPVLASPPAPPPEPPAPPAQAPPVTSVVDEAEVTAPQPMLRGLGPGVDLDEVPAPPPMPAPAVGSPRPITMTAMPAVELVPPSRDGTSPFARDYVVPQQAEPPPRPPPPPVPPMVVEDLGSIGRLDAPAVFADVAEGKATIAWRDALYDAVERGHQGGTVAPEEKARLFLDDEGWEDIRYESFDAAAPRDAAALSMPVLDDSIATVGDGEPITDEEPPSPLEELVDALEGLDEAAVKRAQKQLLERGVEAVPALEERFPGRLHVDPFDPGENVRTAPALGPLVEVLYALGPAGLDAAVPHLDSRYPAHRFAAVLLFALTPDSRGIDLLRARLHDQEPRIRLLAADALAPFVAHPRFEAVLVHLRDRLQSPLLDARRRAVQLLGAFRDVGGVPLLIALLDGRGATDLAEDVRQALRAITLQDFGTRARGWDRWWQKAKKKTRVDWLIEGLSSEDRELRTIAHVELAAITGDDFGYRADEPRRNRQRAVAVFQTWWSEEQKRPKAS